MLPNLCWILFNTSSYLLGNTSIRACSILGNFILLAARAGRLKIGLNYEVKILERLATSPIQKK